MKRLDVYTAVHKMQRARLFDLTVAAGKTDPDDTLTITRLGGAVCALVDELTSHAEHEDVFIHPLLRSKVPALAASLEVAHVELDSRLEQLRATAISQATKGEDPNTLYRALSSFTATYLEHLEDEEGESLPALWEHCSDEELFGIMVSFRGSRSDLVNITSLVAQLPTLNPSEIAHFVSVGIQAADVSALAQILAATLSPTQLGALRQTTTV